MPAPFKIFLQIAAASASPPPVHGLIIGLDPAVKGLAEGPHPLRHGLVAYPHLAQIVVHVLAETVEQRLRQLGAALHRPQAAQQQPQMQQNRSKRPLTVSGTPKSR